MSVLTTILFRVTFATALACFINVCSLNAAETAKPPAVGDEARDFNLTAIDGEMVKLSQINEKGPVVLLVLRGYPGYQCPVCTSQVGQFLAKAKQFASQKTNIILVYPGPADDLKKHTADFIRGKTLPENVRLVLDPDYKFTIAYNLRWDAKNETAFPSTFVIEKGGKISFSKVSKTHGDRASADEVLKALGKP